MLACAEQRRRTVAPTKPKPATIIDQLPVLARQWQEPNIVDALVVETLGIDLAETDLVTVAGRQAEAEHIEAVARVRLQTGAGIGTQDRLATISPIAMLNALAPAVRISARACWLAPAVITNPAGLMVVVATVLRLNIWKVSMADVAPLASVKPCVNE